MTDPALGGGDIHGPVTVAGMRNKQFVSKERCLAGKSKQIDVDLFNTGPRSLDVHPVCEPHRWAAWGGGVYGELNTSYRAFSGLGIRLFKSQRLSVKESREKDVDDRRKP